MTRKIIRVVTRFLGIDLVQYDRKKEYYSALFDKYRDFTMVPQQLFISNLSLCDKYKHLAGDFVECGVWRGGMSAAMAELLGKSRKVHLFDSFEGLPPVKEIDGPGAMAWQKNQISEGYYDNCAADQSFAMEAMRLAGHTNYKIYQGWFENTLSGIQTNSIAVLRLDGDWYDSVKICLEKLYPMVIDSGLIIIDDYYAWDGCSRAVHDYLSEIKSPSRLCQWNNSVAYLIKKS